MEGAGDGAREDAAEVETARRERERGRAVADALVVGSVRVERLFASELGAEAAGLALEVDVEVGRARREREAAVEPRLAGGGCVESLESSSGLDARAEDEDARRETLRLRGETFGACSSST